MIYQDDESDLPGHSFHHFEAFHDHERDDGPMLLVAGEVEYPEDCWTVSLERMHSSINPKILMLRLAEVCTDDGEPVISRIGVSWSEPTTTEYDEIHVLPGGPVLKVRCLD